MNANTNTTPTNTTVAPVAQNTNTQGNTMNANNNTPTQIPATQQRRYKMTPTELYLEAVDKTIDTKKTATQVSASGHEFKGLNRAILNEAKAELQFKSNKWFTKKAMDEAGLIPVSEDDYGVILFSSKLKDIAGSKNNKKEKIITYYRVFNEDSLEVLPL